MKSNYKRLGDYIKPVNIRNTQQNAERLLGINIDKYFMPSVANVVGTDLSTYKLVRNNQFACNRMHVGRDYRLPVAMSQTDDEFMVSPAYDVFEIKDTKILDPEFLMMWFSRKEFDRNAWFYTDGDVRGGLPWKSFEDMTLPVPTITKQREIVKEYNVIKDRIALNQQLIQKLEETARAIYKQWFVDFEFPFDFAQGRPDLNGKPYKSNGGEMVFNEELEMDIPHRWKCGSFSDLGEVVGGATPSKEIDDYYTSNGISWITPKDISIQNKKFISKGEIDITSLGYKKSSTRILPKGSVLFSSRAPIGYLAISSNELCTNQGFKSIIPKKEIGTAYIYYSLRSKTPDILNEASGSTFDEVSGTMMKNFKVIVPENKLTLYFQQLCEPIFEYQECFEKHLIICYKLKNLLFSKMSVIEI
jgi:type I restriction enzyme S subunit